MSGDETWQLVTMTEIAELAGVRRPSVSTWRRRHSDFPVPVRDDGQQPLFEAGEIADWLGARRVPDAGTDEPATYGDRFRERFRLRTLATLRGLLPGDRLLAAGLALAALRHVDGRSLTDLSIAVRRAQEVEERHPELIGVLSPDIEPLTPESEPLLRTIDDMCLTSGPAAVAERLITEAERLGSGLRMSMTPDPIAKLIAQLAGDPTGRTVYDPAVGSGSLLLEVLRRGVPRRVGAADVDRTALRMLRQRLVVRDLPLESIEILEQDSLGARAWFGADVVVLDPPFTASDQSSDEIIALIRWVRFAVAQTVPGGYAIVVVPTWMLTRAGARDPVAAARDTLVRQGSVAAVLQLPRRVHSFRTGTELAILVLQKSPTQERRMVLVCNAERAGAELDEFGGAGGWVRASLTGEAPSQMPDYAGWVESDRLDRRRSLLPSHVLSQLRTPARDIRRFDAARSKLAAMPAERPLGVAAVPASALRRRHTSVREHVGARRLRLLPGHRIADEDRGGNGPPLIGVPEVRDNAAVGKRRITEAASADFKTTKLTAPGDVVLLPSSPPRAFVDLAGGAVVEGPARIVRILDDRSASAVPWMTPHVLAHLLVAPRNADRATGSLARRVDVTRLELPELNRHEVARLERVLRELREHRARAAERLSVLDELTEALVVGVADGVLTVAGDKQSSSDDEDVEAELRGTT